MKITEKERFVVLITLFLIALGIIIWLRTGYESGSIQTLQQ